jgi:hypothetical protein
VISFLAAAFDLDRKRPESGVNHMELVMSTQFAQSSHLKRLLTPTPVRPTLGAASRYYVSVEAVENQGGVTTPSVVASLDTPNTQLVIPPGILNAGSTYVFEIGARATPNTDLNATPDMGSLPDGLSPSRCFPCHLRRAERKKEETVLMSSSSRTPLRDPRYRSGGGDT